MDLRLRACERREPARLRDVWTAAGGDPMTDRRQPEEARSVLTRAWAFVWSRQTFDFHCGWWGGILFTLLYQWVTS
jgi:hypothetical protein